MKRLKAVAWLLVLGVSLPSPLWGQDKNEGKVDFTALRDKRQEIAREIDQAQSEIFVLRERIGRTPPIYDLEGYQKGSKMRLEDLGRDLETAKKQNPARVSAIEQEIRNHKQAIERLDADIANRREADKRMNEQQTLIARKQADLAGIESRIDELLRRDIVTQDFKRMMSMTFAFLVLAVIGGFFWIAYHDKRVRRTIFAGEAGIQFITLFSLVIAIILFGITGILGDKELSALLGGLSGYILGRSMNARPGGGAGTAAPGTVTPGGTTPAGTTGGATAPATTSAAVRSQGAVP